MVIGIESHEETMGGVVVKHFYLACNDKNPETYEPFSRAILIKGKNIKR